MMKTRNLFSGVLMAALLLLSINAASAQDVDKNKSPVIIDGILSEQNWQRVPDFKDFTILQSRKAAGAATEAWISKDNNWLYLAFKCYDDQPGNIKIEQKDRNAPIHKDDSVEVFISPGTDGKTYFHFITNAAGVQGDNFIENKNRTNWDGYWRSAAKINDREKYWTAEIAVPLFYLSEKKGNGDWKFNVVRSKRHDGEEYSSWSQLSILDFHTVAEFGQITGLEKITPQKVFAPVMLQAKRGALQDFPIRCYEVDVSMRNDGKEGELQLAAEDIIGKTVKTTDIVKVKIPEAHTVSKKIIVPVEELLRRKARYTAFLNDELGKWFVSGKVSEASSSKITDIFFDRSFYTAEKTAGLVLISRYPASYYNDLRAEIIFNAKKYELTLKKNEERIEVPVDGLNEGVHKAEIKLIKKGKIIISQVCVLKKLAPLAEGNEVKVDRWRRAMLVNGKPFFAVGMYADNIFYSTLEKIGFNTLIPWAHSTPENLKEILKQSEDHNLYVIPSPHFNFKKHYSIYANDLSEQIKPALKNELPQIVDICRNNSAMLAYYLFDEPGGEAGRKANNLFYDHLTGLDLYHPASSLFCRGLPEGRWDMGFSLLDIYWQTANTNEYAALPAVEFFQKAKRDSVGRNLPFWIAIQNENYAMSTRLTNSQEQRANTYLALVHEATGVFYFIWPIRLKSTFDTLTQLTREMKILSPILLTRTPRQEVNIVNGHSKMVSVLLKKRPEGGWLLLAVNAFGAEADVKFSIPGLTDGANIERMFGKGAPGVKEQSFTDHFKAYDTRAYVITGDAINDREPVKITIDITNKQQSENDSKGNNLLPAIGPKWVKAFGGNEIVYNGKPAESEKESMLITRKSQDGAQVVKSTRIILKPDTKYIFEVTTKGEFDSAPSKWGGPTFMLYSLDQEKSLVYLQTHADHLRNYKTFHKEFITGNKPETVECSIVSGKNKFAGKLWINDIKLFEDVSETVTSINLMPNSGFEIASNPGYPDYWMTLPWAKFSQQDLVGGNNPAAGLDDTEKFEGKYSFKLRGMHQVETLTPRFGSAMISLQKEKKHMFSVYMKASQPDVEVWMRMAGPNKWSKFKVGKEWKRYSAVGVPLQAWGKGYLKLQIRTEGAAGLPVPLTLDSKRKINSAPSANINVWIDAVQLEAGTEVTAYEKDMYTKEN
ncbi:MAG: sugar-binding protein [Planctomycetota bacterium]|jgi:hypothetical protein